MGKTIAWVEIPTNDFERAVNFYQNVLKLELQIIESNDEKMGCFPSGEGAIVQAPGYEPSKQGTLVSLNAEKDLDVAIERVVENGGEILKPKTKIEMEGAAYFAIFLDSEGNRVGLYGE